MPNSRGQLYIKNKSPLQNQIECAIARGLTDEQIATKVGCRPGSVAEVHRYLNILVIQPEKPAWNAT